jgi:hypothetical protein
VPATHRRPANLFPYSRAMIESRPRKSARLLFWRLALTGRPSGGVRPGWVIHWLVSVTFPKAPQESRSAVVA